MGEYTYIFDEIFKQDLINTKGYTKEEVDAIFEEKGEDFIGEMMDDFWTNWSENFPVEDKGAVNERE